MKITSVHVCAFLMIFVSAVTYFGFVHPEYTALFKKLFPFHLLLILVLLVISHEDKNEHFWTFILTAYAGGFIIELLGLNTGAIFGNYTYGKTLGIKFADIPLIMGVHWTLLIYGCGVLVKEFGIKNHIIRALVGALILTTLDVLIEPVAVKYDFWNWADFEVPFQNYVGCFVFSFLMLRFFFLMRFRKSNLAAIVFFIVQFVFFFLLNMQTI